MHMERSRNVSCHLIGRKTYPLWLQVFEGLGSPLGFKVCLVLNNALGMKRSCIIVLITYHVLAPSTGFYGGNHHPLFRHGVYCSFTSFPAPSLVHSYSHLDSFKSFVLPK